MTTTKRAKPVLSVATRHDDDNGSAFAAVLKDHEDIVVKILARLPAKTLMRLKCVYKTWRSLITSDPHFIKKHAEYDAQRSINDSDLCLLVSMKNPISIALADLKDFTADGDDDCIVATNDYLKACRQQASATLALMMSAKKLSTDA